MNNKSLQNSVDMINVEILVLTENSENIKKFLQFMKVKFNDDEFNDTTNTIINNNSFKNDNEISAYSFEADSNNVFVDIKDEIKQLYIRLNLNKVFVTEKFYHVFVILLNSKEILQFKKVVDSFSQKIKKIVSKTEFDFLFLIIEENSSRVQLIPNHQENLLKEKKNFLKEKNLERFILVNLEYSDRNHLNSFLEFVKTRITKSFSKFPEFYVRKKQTNTSIKFVKHMDIINRIKGKSNSNKSNDNQNSLTESIQTDEFITFEENKTTDNEEIEENYMNDQYDLDRGRNNKNTSVNIRPDDKKNQNSIIGLKNKIPIPRGILNPIKENMKPKWENFENYSFVKDLKHSQGQKNNSPIKINNSTQNAKVRKGNNNRSKLNNISNLSNLNDVSKSRERNESNLTKNQLAHSTFNASSRSDKNLHHKRIYSDVNLNKLKFGDSFTTNTDRSSERAQKSHSDEHVMKLFFKFKNNIFTFLLTSKHTGYLIALEVNKFFHLNLKEDSLKYLSKKIIRKINKILKYLNNSSCGESNMSSLKKEYFIDFEKILNYKNEKKIKVIVSIDNNKLIFYVKTSDSYECNIDEYVDEIIQCLQHKDSYDITSLREKIKNTLNNSIKSTV